MTFPQKRTRMSAKDKREQAQRDRVAEAAVGRRCWHCDFPAVENSDLCSTHQRQEFDRSRATAQCEACLFGLHDLCGGCACEAEETECDPYVWNRMFDKDKKEGLR